MEVILKDDEKLYPLGTEDPDGTPYLTTWVDSGENKWFYAVIKGERLFRPYWNAPFGGHRIIKIFDNKEEAKKHMVSIIDLNNIDPSIYLSFGWIVKKEGENEESN